MAILYYLLPAFKILVFFLSLFTLIIVAVNCGDPGTPTNGQRSLSSTTYNSVVTYTCDVGYSLQGSNSRTCQSDRQWNASVPQCNRMLVGMSGVLVIWKLLLSNVSLFQPSAPAPVKMEGPALLLTLVPVMLGGLECSVKQVCDNKQFHMCSNCRVLSIKGLGPSPSGKCLCVLLFKHIYLSAFTGKQ